LAAAQFLIATPTFLLAEANLGLLGLGIPEPVEFSNLTNSSNRSRERAAAMIQQDLAPLGIRLNIVTQDSPAVIQRITQTFQYDPCLSSRAD
jgi:ABC-type transport system substrate-binding protein